jgi:hypothetical protein
MLTLQQIETVWNRATVVANYNPNLWRKDFAGAWIRRDMYGMRSPFGWSACRKNPNIGPAVNTDNLMAAHWRNNMMKGANYPTFKSIVTSDGNHNVDKIQSWRVG